MSSVSAFIDEKVAQVPAGKVANEKKKMIVVIDPDDSKVLGNLAVITSTGKIELGSELLKHAINEAKAAGVKANKLNTDGSVVGAKPKTPAPAAPAAPAPAPPAVK